MNIYKCLLRDWRLSITCFVYNQEFDNSFKRIFSILTCIYIFLLYQYTSHWLSYIHIQTHILLVLTAQYSTNEWEWTSMISNLMQSIFFIFLYITNWKNNLFHAESVLYVAATSMSECLIRIGDKRLFLFYSTLNFF